MLHKSGFDHNSNDSILILDLQIWMLYRFLPRFLNMCVLMYVKKMPFFINENL